MVVFAVASFGSAPMAAGVGHTRQAALHDLVNVLGFRIADAATSEHGRGGLQPLVDAIRIARVELKALSVPAA